MKVSVVLPTLNEVGAIKSVLDDMPADVVDEILVVDGHSTDGTPELVKKLGYEVIVQEGRGCGDAFTTGVKHATGDVIILMDADGSHNPADIPKLLKCIDEGADAAFGSRYMPGSGSDDDTIIRYIGNKLFTFLLNKVQGVELTDGLFLYVAAKREVFEAIEMKSANFEYCVEFPIKVHKAGFRIAQVPCFEPKRLAGRSKVNAFYHGLRILWVILTG